MTPTTLCCRVLYVSIHRYENGWFWPNLRESNFDFIGTGKGQGHNINIPLNKVLSLSLHQYVYKCIVAFRTGAPVYLSQCVCAVCTCTFEVTCIYVRYVRVRLR